MKSAVAVAVVVVSGLVVASPASAQNKREMQMMADIRMLQEQNQQLQVSLAQLGDALNNTLKALNGRLDDQANAMRKAVADHLRVVREGVSENNVRISQLSQELEALRLSIPQYQPPTPCDPATAPGTPPPTPGAGTSTTGGTPATPAPPMPQPTLGPGIQPQRLYDTAWADYTAGQWELCISGFDTYLRTFPRSDLADEAQFYIGECNYSDGKHQEAVQAYTQVIVNYPKGQSVAPAYYKRGLAFERLGQIERARESYESVTKLYPDSDAARMAKQSLDRLNRGKPPE
jgi:tol-pal system protein YbgF